MYIIIILLKIIIINFHPGVIVLTKFACRPRFHPRRALVARGGSAQYNHRTPVLIIIIIMIIIII